MLLPFVALSLALAQDDLAQLGQRIEALRRAGRPAELIADVAVYHKAALWQRRYPEESYRPQYVEWAGDSVKRGLARADELLRTASPEWARRKGRFSRGYVSRVDGSVQPYALIVPELYDPARPIRLDVFLHGRSRVLSEVSFLAAHDVDAPVPPPQNYIQLEPYGRGNNSYFWAGETDVWEAIESVKARYNIDADRIMLRGFSMGGTGAWQLGLHYPDRWAAVECGAGYVETRHVVEDEIGHPLHRSLLNIHNAVLSAVNLLHVPWVAYAGELDVQLVSLLRVRDQLNSMKVEIDPKRTLFLVGPKVGHRFHPESKQQSDAFIDAAPPRHAPETLRFTAYTPRYGAIWGFHLDTFEELYQRAELRGGFEDVRTSNVAVLRVDRARTLSIDGDKVSGPVFEKRGGHWVAGEPQGLRKRAGLQGPIDDAFQEAFLCVRPASGSEPALDRFRHEFAKYLRGDIRVKTPDEVTPEDIAGMNLVLFGEPWTNPWIAKVLPGLPAHWTRERIGIKGGGYSAAGRRLAMIYPNPLNPKRYVVLNSGHTFSGARGWDDTSWLLFPRLGDYAVIDAATGRPVAMGLFDLRWR